MKKIKNLVLILGDQLSQQISSLQDFDDKSDAVLMMEVRQEATYVKHHKLKIAFLFTAMRHFAEQLRQQQRVVHYLKLTANDNQHSFVANLQHFINQHSVEKVIVTEPGEYRVLQDLNICFNQLPCATEIREDDRFFCSIGEFKTWAAGRKQLRMEYFYRAQRVKHQILLSNNKPLGGRWNFDKDNRNPLNDVVALPALPKFTVDSITTEVIALVKDNFNDHPGELTEFKFAVTRRQALHALKHFISKALDNFGPYQDAMLTDEYVLFHSVLSQYINCGLLLPKEVCAAAEQAYHEGHAKLQSVEGFIRQILGWREYVRGIYWLHMPGYAKLNALEATQSLPAFYWTGNTDMACLSHVIKQTLVTATSHHIQRLMITGNFAMLLGVTPAAICDWYLAVYADAYEWVELPNTAGMAIFSDGGIMASKPYAASGAYINRMSNFCKQCRYAVKQRQGQDACPFNVLYWDFLARNRKHLLSNPRMTFAYKNLDKLTNQELAAIRHQAKQIISQLTSMTY